MTSAKSLSILALLAAAASILAAQSDSNCRILGTATDSEKKEIQADADLAYKRFKEHFALTPNPIAIDLREKKERPADAGRLYLPWLSLADMERMVGDQVPPEYMDQVVEQIRKSRPLSHEIGHMLLIDYAAARAEKAPQEGRKNFGNYGSAHLPDWADEAFAVMCEHDASIKSRISQAKTGTPIALQTLFSMEHPHLKEAEGEKAAGSSGASVKIVGSDTVNEEHREHMRAVANFYAQVAALTAFIKERGGAEAFKVIIDGLADGKEMKDILPTLPKLPSTIDQLDADWKVWMKK